MATFALKIEQSTTQFVSIAKDSLGVYQSVHNSRIRFDSAVRGIRDKAQVFLNLLYALWAAAIVVLVLPVVGLSVAVLIMALVYVNLLLWGNQATIRKQMDVFTIEEAVRHHLKIERSLRQLLSLSRSRFLTRTPILGFLFKRFLRKASFIERALFERAYPHFSEIPNNVVVQPHNPNDSWQGETDNSDVYEKYYLTK